MEEENMTAEELHRFTKALQNHEFRALLHDYAQEISDPDNRRVYEEEIKLLEQERGNSVEFIHPTPFRAVKTSLDGQRKCFINICSCDRVGKPECRSGVSEEGRRGWCWSLPHSLHPGRQDTDGKGNKIVIYDVVFHPDTLHMAGKNKRFMDMVDDAAIRGIQGAFKVTLDHKNVKEARTKYKGTPQPCVIRRPIPGVSAREPSGQPDPLAFPYPDEPNQQQAKAEGLPSAQHRSDADPGNIPVQPVETKQPTRPDYTLKYRSFIDLQDFRCSRDSAQSPRPKEIIVTVDLPLLKSASDASLEVKDKTLLLESRKPAYRLELPLAYPVDEDRGEAKFNKQKRQLAITLPVLPPGSFRESLGNGAEASLTEEQLPPISAQHSCGIKEEFFHVLERREETQEAPQGNFQESLTASVLNRCIPEAATTHGESQPPGAPDRRQRGRGGEEDHGPPAAALREVDRDGNETVISDHSTTAGITFLTSLMFELD
ncbi:protein kintoun [Salarias fasciatus]|uniref:protein kintoun n=1 Tax=Salarias fasciatus TaxID=181472 RepID=UPI001176ACE1|nr:protein kintoun [Salarias fasciatus]